MKYDLELNDRPFQAIKNGTKKIEGRTPKNPEDSRYTDMSAGDTIVFTNNVSSEQITCEVLSVSHYDDVRTMLQAEGTKNVLSSGGNIEEGIQSYHSLGDYEERIKKYGIYAIAIKLKNNGN